MHDFITALFSQIEIRLQEHLVKKIQMVHRLLFSDQPKKDYSFLCFELLIADLSENSITIDTPPLHYVEVKVTPGSYNDYELKIEGSIPSPLASYIKDH